MRGDPEEKEEEERAILLINVGMTFFFWAISHISLVNGPTKYEMDPDKSCDRKRSKRGETPQYLWV